MQSNQKIPNKKTIPLQKKQVSFLLVVGDLNSILTLNWIKRLEKLIFTAFLLDVQH